MATENEVFVGSEKVPLISSIRPLIFKADRLLLLEEIHKDSSIFNPAKFLLPNIRVDGSFSNMELPSIIFSHLGVVVEVDGKVRTLEEFKEPGSVSPLGTTFRTLSLRCQLKGGRISINPKAHQGFLWVLEQELGDLPIDYLSKRIISQMLNTQNA